MGNAASLGVTPASNVTGQVGLVYNSVFPALANAGFVGGLSQNTTSINVLSQLTPNIAKDFYTFNFEQGSALKLSFNGVVGPNSDSNGDPPGSWADGVNANLRFQLYNITGTLIADSGGTPAQQAAYANLTSSSGLTTTAGGYYVQVSAAPGTSITSQTSYNFQLYSGSTYNTNLTYAAQTQPFDPNLFATASATVTPSVSLQSYINSATLSGAQASATNIGTLDANQSELVTNSQINSANQTGYYTFDFNSGSALKFNLNNTTNEVLQQSLQVQLYDSTGKLVADNNGTLAQQEAYQQFNSGAGLAAANGVYSLKVTYAPGAIAASAQNFNFQLYSGGTYDTQYTTTTTLPTNTNEETYGSGVGIFAAKNAQLFTRQEYHAIGETAASGPNIGWLYENKNASNVVSQLTRADSTDFYNFTLQKGSNLKLAFNNQTSTAKTRIQLLDPTGTRVLADNYGTDVQKQAFAQLTSSTGLAANPQQYAVKVTYAPGANTTQTQTYDFQLYSGTSYTNLYKFTASAQTYQNAVLSGNTHVAGYNRYASAASYLTSIANGTDASVNIIADLIS